MTPSSSAVGLSEIESMSLFVLLFTVVYVYYQYPRLRLLPGGQGIPLTGSIDESTPSQDTCGLDRIVCPHCGIENASISSYCSNCVGRLWTR